MPLIAARSEATKMTEGLHNFEIAEMYTRAFFDKYLMGQKNSLLDQKSTPDPRVRVDRFGVAQP